MPKYATIVGQKIEIDPEPWTIKKFELSRPYVFRHKGVLYVLVNHTKRGVGLRAHPAVTGLAKNPGAVAQVQSNPVPGNGLTAIALLVSAGLAWLVFRKPAAASTPTLPPAPLPPPPPTQPPPPPSGTTQGVGEAATKSTYTIKRLFVYTGKFWQLEDQEETFWPPDAVEAGAWKTFMAQPAWDVLWSNPPPYYYVDYWLWGDGGWKSFGCSANYKAPGCHG